MTSFNIFALNFVANALWQVAFVAAIAALGNWLLLRVASARYRYFVWVTALILSVALPLWSALPLERETHWMTFFSTPGAVSNLEESLEISPAKAQPQQPDHGLIWRNLPFAKIFVGLYLLFFLYRIHKLWRAWKLALAIRQSAFPVFVTDTLQAVMKHCHTTLGLSEVALVGSPSVAVPVTVGLRQPVIILPERLLVETSTELLSAAIGHEMAHIKRRDFAWNLVYELLFLPISFHPAAALVKRRINETRELACDETVSELILDAQVYARSLVSLAHSSFSLHHPTYILGVNDADILEERVMKLLAKKTSANTRRATALLGIALFALALAGAAAAAFPINIQQDQNQSVTTAKRFVGAWKRPNSDPPTDNAYVFMLEGNQLKGTIRTVGYLKPMPGSGAERKIFIDEHSPLANLTVEGTTLTWTFTPANSPVLHWRASFVSEDELLVEFCGKQRCSPDQPAELKETLKRQK